MTPSTVFAGRDVALFGLGGSGIATALSLQAGGAIVTAWDDKPSSVEAAREQGIGIGDLAQANWSRFAALVLAPGVPLTHPVPHWSVGHARAAGIEVIGDIELFCRERAKLVPDAPFVAITGTNGKSTTTALIAHILAHAGFDVQMGGNIGKAILSLEPPAPGRFHVIEMSSYQVDLTPTLAPTIGLLMNLSPDHIDRHGTIEHYASVKERLVAKAKLALIGVDDPMSDEIGRRLSTVEGADVYPVSATKELRWGYFANGDEIVARNAGETLDEALVLGSIAGIPTLRGRHNAQNAAFACAVARHAGVEAEEIAAALPSFPGLPHRMEQVPGPEGLVFINDSKATNAESTARALASFPRVHWILGGKPKEGGIESLAEYFPKIAKAYLIGESAGDFARTLDAQVPYEQCGTLEVAVVAAARDAAREVDAVVLFSPACASFDQFRSFEHRGDVFREIVAGLREE